MDIKGHRKAVRSKLRWGPYYFNLEGDWGYPGDSTEAKGRMHRAQRRADNFHIDEGYEEYLAQEKDK